MRRPKKESIRVNASSQPIPNGAKARRLATVAAVAVNECLIEVEEPAA